MAIWLSVLSLRSVPVGGDPRHAGASCLAVASGALGSTDETPSRLCWPTRVSPVPLGVSGRSQNEGSAPSAPHGKAFAPATPGACPPGLSLPLPRSHLRAGLSKSSHVVNKPKFSSCSGLGTCAIDHCPPSQWTGTGDTGRRDTEWWSEGGTAARSTVWGGLGMLVSAGLT